MNLLGLKCPTPSLTKWPRKETRVGVRPLSPFYLEQAKQNARAIVKHDGDHRDLEEMIQTLAAATEFTADEIRNSLHPNEVGFLHLFFEIIQNKSSPDITELTFEVKKRIHDDPGLVQDAVAIAHSKCPTDFYGKPMIDLTYGQLVYFLVVRQVFEEQDDNKKVSKKWLTQ